MRIRKKAKKEGPKNIFIILFLTSILLCLVFFMTDDAGYSIDIYIYDFLESSLRDIRSYSNELPNLKTITFYNLNNSNCIDEFLKIVDLLVINNIQILPPNFCTSCVMKQGVNWQRICIQYSCPLLLLFQDEKLVAIIISRYDKIILSQAFDCPRGSVEVFMRNGSSTILNDKAKTQIESMFRSRRRSKTNIFQFLITILVTIAIIIGILKLRSRNSAFQSNRNIRNIIIIIDLACAISKKKLLNFANSLKFLDS